MVAPYPPTLIAPANRASLAAVAANGHRVRAEHSEPGTSITKFSLRRRLMPSGALEYWNGTIWTTPAVYVTLTTPVFSGDEVNLNVVTWSGTNGQVYQWSVSLQDVNVLNSPYAVDRLIRFETAPTVNVVAPLVGSHTTSRPLASWVYTDVNAYPGLSYRARLFNDLQYGAGGFDPATSAALWDSEEVFDPGGYKVTPAYDLVIGRTYKTYVRVTNIMGQMSAWDDSPVYSLATNLPPAPSVTLTPRPDLGTMQIEAAAAFNLLAAHQASPVDTFDGAGPTSYQLSGWEVLLNASLAIVDDPATDLTGPVLEITATGADMLYLDTLHTDLTAEDTAYTDLAAQAAVQEP